MREVIKHGIYKHFKGKYYVVMGISVPVSLETIQDLIAKDYMKIFEAKHTEKVVFNIIDYNAENPFFINTIVIDERDGKLYHYEALDPNELVIYKSLYDGTGAYARPLDMFLSEVDKEKYPNTTQQYRMELIK
jgi:hypothetical protein